MAGANDIACGNVVRSGAGRDDSTALCACAVVVAPHVVRSELGGVALVFELAFENIQLSSRHKSGIAVRFPRMARWRHDKRPEDADTLDNLKNMVRQKRAVPPVSTDQRMLF